MWIAHIIAAAGCAVGGIGSKRPRRRMLGELGNCELGRSGVSCQLTSDQSAGVGVMKLVCGMMHAFRGVGRAGFGVGNRSNSRG